MGTAANSHGSSDRRLFFRKFPVARTTNLGWEVSKQARGVYSGGRQGEAAQMLAVHAAVPPRRERLWGATPGKHCRLAPEPVSGSAFRAAVSDLATPRSAFRRSGTAGSNPVPS